MKLKHKKNPAKKFTVGLLHNKFFCGGERVFIKLLEYIFLFPAVRILCFFNGGAKIFLLLHSLWLLFFVGVEFLLIVRPVFIYFFFDVPQGMSLADFAKAYLEQKRNPDAPKAELKGFAAKDFKDFEDGALKAIECVRQGREPEMPDIPPDVIPWANEVKNQLANFFNAYKVYRSNQKADAGGFKIEQFQQFETSVNSMYPGLLPVLFPSAAEMDWFQNMAAGRPGKDDERFAKNFLSDLKF